MSDLAFITGDKGPVNEALDLARVAIEKFYQTGNATSGLTAFQSAEASSLANRAAENMAIDLSPKTVPELIELLSHRDNDLKQRVAAVLKAKAVESKAADDVRTRDQTKEYLVVPVVIQTLFYCATINTHPQLQKDILVLVSGLLTEPLKDRIRQVGALTHLTSLWKRGTEEELLSKILSLTLELTTNEANCLACKQTKRVPELCGLLNPDSQLSVANRALLIGILRNLSKVPKNRDQISKTGAPTLMMQLVNDLWKIPVVTKKGWVPGKDAMLTQQLLETLANLANGAVLKASVTPEQLQMLMSIVDGRKTLKKDWMATQQKDQEFFIMTCIQSQLLQLLANLATTEQNRRTLGQLHIVQQLLMFCLPGEESISADAFFFLVDALDHLIQDGDNLATFLQYRGLQVALGFITSPKNTDFQQHRQLNHRAIDLIISCVRHGFQTDDTLNSVMQTLILYATQNTDDLALQSTIMKIMDHLSCTEAHCNGLSRIPGLLDFVTRHTLEGSVLEIIEAGVVFLANVGAVPQIKRTLISQASTLVPGLISFLGNDSTSLQTRIARLLASVFATDRTGAHMIVDRSGVLVMLTLIASNHPELQEQGLAVLDALAEHYPDPDQLRHSYLASSVPPVVVSLLSSEAPNVQLRAFSLLSRLIDHRACRLSLESLGVVKIMQDLKKQPTNKKISATQFETLQNMIDTILPKLVGTMADLNAAISMTEKKPNEAADQLLSGLTKWQLMQLVKFALNKFESNGDHEMMQLIDDTIQANIANPPPRKAKAGAQAPHEAIDSTSIVAESGLKPIAMVPVAPPAAPKKGGPGAPPPPPAGGSYSGGKSSAGSVFDQLTSLAKTGAIKLKKVQTAAELEEKAKQSHRSNDSLAQVFQGIKEASSNPEGTRLLEQGTTDGRQFWVKDIGKYIEELQKAFKLDYHFMKILHHIISSTVATIPFDSLLAMSHKKESPISPKDLADTLRNLGFTIKHNIILPPNSETPTTQYTSVIVPGDLPTHEICRTIVWVVAQANTAFAATLPPAIKSQLSSGSTSSAPSSSSSASQANAASSSTSASSEPFECRLCHNSFPASAAVNVSDRPFCKPCSEVVLEALKKRGVQ
jgi:hypothetical protein